MAEKTATPPGRGGMMKGAAAMQNVQIYAFADEASPTIDGQVAAMVRNGLKGLEIRNVDGQNVSDISLEKAAEVRAKLDAAGLITWSIGSPIGKIDIVKDDFEAHMDKLGHTIEVAKALGAKNIRMFSFFMPRDEAPEKYRDEVFKRLRRMIDAAAGTGVALCHENEKGIYGDMAVRCLEIHREFPELAGVFDPANYVQCGQDTAEAWAMLKQYIKYVHIKDALPDCSVVPAGHGVGHVADIVADYIARGGVDFTVEPHLKVFAGLSGLERQGDRTIVSNFVYDNNDAAFDAACAALREILAKIA